MSAREWLRRPGHLLVAFLVVTLLPACVLGALGWRLFQQDVALESQYLQDRLEHAADLAVATLDGQLSRLQDTLSSTSDLPAGNDVVRVAFGPDGVEATPADRLLYYPPSVTPVSLPTQPFLQGEALEFGRRDAAAAGAVFRKLTESRDAVIRAGALLRLARDAQEFRPRARRARRVRRTGAARDDSRRSRPCGTGGASGTQRGPARAGRRDEADRETRTLLTDLQGGRWKLDRTTFEFHAQGLSDRLEKPAPNPPAALALSAAVTTLWERYQSLGAGDTVSQGRQSVWIDDRPMLLVWKGTQGEHERSCGRRRIPQCPVAVGLNASGGRAHAH